MRLLNITRKTARGMMKVYPAAVFLLLTVSGCRHDAELPQDMLARVGNETLTVDEVRRQIPSGLSEEDSLRFVKAYVNSWIDARLIADVAAEEVDMDEIDRMVRDYRSRLIMEAYRRIMFERHGGVAEDSLRAFYEAHKADYTLERPMVRGVYLKVSDDAPNLRVLRRQYRSDRPEDIDAMEKEVLSSAIHYDYFRDRWVDWEQIENRIPADFGQTPASWPVKGRTLDFSSGGYTYLLYVTEVLPAGAPMPFENARALISQRLLAIGRKAYDARLLIDLRDQALRDGNLHIP